MNNPFEPWFAAGRPVILDGGLGTELERRGCGNLGRLWSSAAVESAPETLRNVHRDFLAAGADCIVSATYQAAVPTLLECGFDRDTALEFLGKAARMAMEERDAFARGIAAANRSAGPLVAASIGPFGAHLADGSEYTGDYALTEEELMDFQRERWHCLAGSGVDVMACETIPSAVEIRALLRLARETPDMPTWLSLSCRDAEHLADGTPLERIVERVNDNAELAALGVNCLSPRLAPEVLERLRSLTRLPLMIYPNASNAWDRATRQPLDEMTPGDFARESRAWRAAGAGIIGGCCRTTPAHIAALAKALST